MASGVRKAFTHWLNRCVITRIPIFPCEVLGYGPIKLSALTSHNWYGFSLAYWCQPSGTDGTCPDEAGNISPHGNPEEPSMYGQVGFYLSWMSILIVVMEHL